MDSTEHQKLKIHLIYLVSILTFMLVLVACSVWTDRPDFTVFLTNSATATSLVLGVIAIVYSFISNSDLSKGLGNILQASNEIGKTKEQISAFLGQAQQMNQMGTTNTEQLSNVSSNINQTVMQLNDALDIISKKTDELHSSVTAIPKRMDDLEAKLIEQQTKKQDNQTNIDQITWSDHEVLRFLQKTTLEVNLLVLACIYAYQSKKELSLEALCKVLGTNIPSHLSGVMQSMNAIDLVHRRVVKNKVQVYTIPKIAPVLTEKAVQDYLISYLDNVSGLTLDEINAWKEKMQSVAQLFE